MQRNRLGEDERNKKSTMKNVYHKKLWKSGMTQAHLEYTPIPLINGKYNGKSDKYFVNLEFCRDPTYSTSDLYEFRMSLFENGEPEDFLLFVCNSNMTLAEIGTLETGVNIQCLCTLVRAEALRQFDLLSADVEST